MGHTEVTQAPAQTGEDILPVGEQLPVVFGQLTHGHSTALGVDDCQSENRCDQQSAQHQQALEEVGPADGGETAQEGVADDDHRGDVHGDGGINANNRIEQGAAGLNTGRGVNGISHQEDDRADHLEGFAGRQEAVGQILGDRNGVVCSDGVFPQTGCFYQPADGVADGQADGDPGLTQTGGVNGSGQAHKNPCAHIGSTGRQGRDPGTHLAATQEVTLLTAGLGLQEEVHTNAYHKNQVDNENKQFRIHFSYLLSRHDCTENKYPLFYCIFIQKTIGRSA